jgi:paraquat-inducible protein B
MKASPTAIGAFTLGAFALALAALIALGSGDIFSHHMRAVAFFTGDLQGLSAGSPVDFLGVLFGGVSAIEINLEGATMRPVIPVYLEFTTDFDIEDLKGKTDSDALSLAREQRLKMAINNGLHARLATQSLITGQSVVELEFDPNAPRRLTGADPATVEIPTSPSDLQQLRAALTQLPIDEVAEAALRLLGDADAFIKSPELATLLRSLRTSSDSFGRLMDSADAQLGPLAANINNTLATARETLVVAQGTLQEARTTFATGDQLMSTDLRKTLKAGAEALQKAEKVLADGDSLLNANSPQRYDLDRTLRNLSATTRSLRLFSEQLERRPNAILLGK